MSYFSPDDFKKWLKQQDSEPASHSKKSRDVIGMTVESKVTSRKLASVMEAEQGDACDLAVDFRENNGVIIDTDGKRFLIEVESGTFFIPRQYVSEAFS